MTFTRLTLGEPRLRGVPRGGPVEEACVEPLTYGANILPDPGFETSPSDVGGYGPDFPIFGPGAIESAYWYTGSAYGEWASEIPDSVHWVSIRSHDNLNPIAYDMFVLSTADPRSGSSHVRQTSDSNGFINNDYLTPVLFYICEGEDSNGNPGLVTARIEPGDYLEASYYIKSTAAAGEEAEIYFYFLDASYTFVGDGGTYTRTAPTLTTSYQQVTDSAVAPSGTRWVVVQYGWQQGAAGSTYSVDMDDMSLEIQP